MLPRQLDRFTIQESGCWYWNGAIDKDGYGKVKYKGRMEQAHRIIYKATFELELETKIHVHHNKCSIKKCVNPFHMKSIWNSEHNVLHKTKIDEILGKKILELYTNMAAWRVAATIGLSTTTVTKFLRQHGFKFKRRYVKLTPVKRDGQN